MADHTLSHIDFGNTDFHETSDSHSALADYTDYPHKDY